MINDSVGNKPAILENIDFLTTNGIVLNNGLNFRKIKIYRKNGDTISYINTQRYNIGLHEIQVWINDNNIARNDSVIKTFTGDWSYTDTSYATDDHFLRTASDGTDRVFSSNSVNDYITITLDKNYTLNDLQSIVFYPTRSGTHVNPNGPYAIDDHDIRSGPNISFDLLDENDTTLISTKISEQRFFYRFDGNADFSHLLFTPDNKTIGGYNIIGGSIIDSDTLAKTKIVDFPGQQQIFKLSEFILSPSSHIQYIDLGSNVIDLGGNFTFETVVKKTDDVIIPSAINYSGLIGWFDADSFDSSTNTWNNKVSGGANADTGGTITIENSSGANGANGTFNYLSGVEASTVTLNATPFDGANNKEYTFIHIDRYTGGTSNQGRIWQGASTNFISGFWYRNGDKYQQDATLFGSNGSFTNWLLSVDQNLSKGGKIKSYYLSGSEYITNIYSDGINGGSAGNLKNETNLSINNGYAKGNDETSNWGSAVVLMYDRHLNDNEIAHVENYLKHVYFGESLQTLPTIPNANDLTIMCLSDRLSPNISWDFRQNITSGRIYSKEGKYANFQSSSGRGSANNVNVTLTESDGFSAGTGSSFVDLEPFEIGGSFSIEIYFKLSDAVNAHGRIFQLSKNSDDYAHNAITFERLGATPNFTLSLYDGSGNLLGTHNNRSFTPSTSEWSHVVFTVSSTEVKCYLNGSTTNGFIDSTLNTSIPYSEGVVNRNSYVLGGRQVKNNTTFTQGEVANIKYFNVWQNKTLTESEVDKLYNSRDMTYANKLELTINDKINLTMTNNDVVNTINCGTPSSFNKIRMIRTTENGIDNWNITEIELYIDGENVCRAPGTSADASSFKTNNQTPDKVIDGNTSVQPNDGYDYWLTDVNTVGEYVQVNLATTYNTNDIEYVMIYNRISDNYSYVAQRIHGVSLQLLNNDDIVYTYEINTTQNYYRFDGPAITYSIKSSSPANLIANSTDKISLINNNQFYHIIGTVDNVDTSLVETFYYGEHTGSVDSVTNLGTMFSSYTTNAFSVDYSTVDHVSHTGDPKIIIPGKANDEDITGTLPYSNYNKAVHISSDGSLHYISFTFNNAYKCRIIYGHGNVYSYNSSTGAHTYKSTSPSSYQPVILKNDVLIDNTMLIQKEIEVDVNAGDVIKIQGGGYNISDGWTRYLLYAIELYTNNIMKLYVDGTLAGSTSVTPFDENTTFEYNYLGRNDLNTNLFIGTIGYFKAWNYDLTSTEVTNAYDSLELLELTKITFNKVRFLRTAQNNNRGLINGNPVDPTRGNRFECTELQIWMNVNGVLTNVAVDGTGIISRDTLLRSGHGLDHINSEDLNNDPTYTFVSTFDDLIIDDPSTNTQGDWWGLKFNEELSINNLAAVVYYSLYGTEYREWGGLSLQLLKDNDIIYTREISPDNPGDLGDYNTEMVKFHGPALPLDYVFATSDSTTQIRAANSTVDVLIDNINQIKYEEFNDLIFSSDFRRMISSRNIFDTANSVSLTYNTDHLLFNHEGLNLRHNDDYLRMDPINYGGDCSFEFYLSLTSGETSNNNYEGTGTRIMASNPNSSNTNRWSDEKSFMIKTNGTNMEFRLDDDGDTPYFTINDFFVANTFTHVVITFDTTNNEIKIYKDGILNTTDTPSDNSKFKSDFEKTLRYIQFGRDFDSPYTRNMKMKYFRIYEKVLSSTSISKLNSNKDIISYYGSNPVTQVQYGTIDTTIALGATGNTHNTIIETPVWGVNVMGTGGISSHVRARQGGPIYKCVGTDKKSDYVLVFEDGLLKFCFFNITSDGNYQFIQRGTLISEKLQTFIQKLNDTNDSTYTMENISKASGMSNTSDKYYPYYRLSAIITERPYIPRRLFNKIRIFRSDEKGIGDQGYNLEIAEFQIWINGTNVAPNITPTNYLERSPGDTTYGITKINNGNTNDVYIATGGGQQSDWSNGTKNLTDDPIEVIFNMDETNINDLQSIVVYGRDHSTSYYRLKGVSLQLIHNDDVLYTQEINHKNGTSNRLVWRFDGPGISDVSTFSTSESTSQIIGDSYSKLFKYTIA